MVIGSGTTEATITAEQVRPIVAHGLKQLNDRIWCLAYVLTYLAVIYHYAPVVRGQDYVWEISDEKNQAW